MNVTDYTKPESTIVGPMTPSRFGSYMLDLIKIWLSDPRNIQSEALKGLTYVDGDSEHAMNASSVYVDLEWPDSQKVAGKTPAVFVTFGGTSIGDVGKGINQNRTHFPGSQWAKRMEFDITIVVRTAAYAGTQYLTELLYMYLNTFADKIQQDSGVSKFMAMQSTPPQLSQSPGDSKDVFNATIVCKALSVFTVTVDTAGPVFQGFTLRCN